MDASTAGTNPIQISSLLQQAGTDPIAFLQSVDKLLEDFGRDGVADASTQRFLARFGDSLKDIINDSDLPQSIKDAANAIIDSHCACPEDSSGAASALANSEVAEPVDTLADDAAAEVRDDVRARSVSDTESTGGSGGSSGVTPDDLVNDLATSGDKRKKTNWLEVLASTLAKVQSTFLDKALAAAEVMANEADSVSESGEGKSKEFLEAQASYTANMQLFTIFSNQVSTSIKSIGEALAGISRKQ